MVKEKYETPHVSVVNTEKIGSLLMVSAPSSLGCPCNDVGAFLACPSDGSEIGWDHYKDCPRYDLSDDYYGGSCTCDYEEEDVYEQC